MNTPINSSIAGGGNSAVGGLSNVTGAAQSENHLATSLAEQDWFAASTLGDGQLIEAAGFSGEGTGIDQAVNKIVSNLG